MYCSTIDSLRNVPVRPVRGPFHSSPAASATSLRIRLSIQGFQAQNRLRDSRRLRGGGLMISQWIRGRLGRRRDRTSTGPIHSRCGGVANTLESLFPRQSLPYFHPARGCWGSSTMPFEVFSRATQGGDGCGSGCVADAAPHPDPHPSASAPFNHPHPHPHPHPSWRSGTLTLTRTDHPSAPTRNRCKRRHFRARSVAKRGK